MAHLLHGRLHLLLLLLRLHRRLLQLLLHGCCSGAVSELRCAVDGPGLRGTVAGGAVRGPHLAWHALCSAPEQESGAGSAALTA